MDVCFEDNFSLFLIFEIDGKDQEERGGRHVTKVPCQIQNSHVLWFVLGFN